MSSGIKLTIVALVAFALGFAGARLVPKADDTPKPAENLAWERAGGTVRLTAKSPGSGYLILQKNADTSRSAVRGPLRPLSWSVERAMNLKGSAIIYELQPTYVCPAGQQCNRCNQADDCPPWPPGPDFLEAVQGGSVRFDLRAGDLKVWLPLLPTRPGIPDLLSD